MATNAVISTANSTNSETNFESYALDSVLSLLDCGFFDCDDELNEAAKRLDAEITDELNSAEKEVCSYSVFWFCKLSNFKLLSCFGAHYQI